MAQKTAADVERLPNNASATAARRYIEDGTSPGGFVKAVLANDFSAAVTKADNTNGEALDAWAMWLTWDIPTDAWGDEEAVRNWNGL
jgi:hypothetical protein